MNNQEDNNKYDGYITIGKTLSDSFDKISLPNKALIDGIGKGLYDAMKPIVDYNLSIAKIYTDEILKQQAAINAMIEPLSKLAKTITEMYEPMINSFSSNITRIFEKIDWSKFDLIYKEIALKYLSNGFYPYRNTEIKYEEVLNSMYEFPSIAFPRVYFTSKGECFFVKNGFNNEEHSNRNIKKLFDYYIN